MTLFGYAFITLLIFDLTLVFLVVREAIRVWRATDTLAFVRVRSARREREDR